MQENESKKTEEQTCFLEVWLEDEDFKKWLSIAAENTHVHYKLCNKTFNLSNMVCQALVSHAAGKKTYNVD